MSQLMVTPRKLREARSQLSYQNSILKKQLNDLGLIEHRLNRLWCGEANDVFHDIFVRDLNQFVEFTRLIDGYSLLLQEAAVNYELKEMENVRLASQR